MERNKPKMEQNGTNMTKTSESDQTNKNVPKSMKNQNKRKKIFDTPPSG